MIKLFSWLSIFFIGVVSTITQAVADELPSVEEVSMEIVGDWQVMSFQRQNGELVDYSNDNIIWSFNDNSEASIARAGFEPFKSSYKVVASRFGWIGITGVFIIVKGLDQQMEDYSRHSKLIARSLTDNGRMRIVNWENNLEFILQKVK